MFIFLMAITDALYGMGFAGGLMLLIFILSRGGMGAGDVKLCFVLGLWLGLKASIVCLMLSFILGGAIGVLLLATGIKKRKDPIPFGPFLCLGAFISYFIHLICFITIGVCSFEYAIIFMSFSFDLSRRLAS